MQPLDEERHTSHNCVSEHSAQGDHDEYPTNTNRHAHGLFGGINRETEVEQCGEHADHEQQVVQDHQQVRSRSAAFHRPWIERSDRRPELRNDEQNLALEREAGSHTDEQAEHEPTEPEPLLGKLAVPEGTGDQHQQPEQTALRTRPVDCRRYGGPPVWIENLLPCQSDNNSQRCTHGSTLGNTICDVVLPEIAQHRQSNECAGPDSQRMIHASILLSLSADQ